MFWSGKIINCTKYLWTSKKYVNFVAQRYVQWGKFGKRDKILLPLAESKKKLKSNGQYGKVFNDYYNKCKSKC